MSKPLLTPAQIAEKYIRIDNPNCANEKRIKGLIRDEMVEYIQVAIDEAVKNTIPVIIEPLTVEDIKKYCQIPAY